VADAATSFDVGLVSRISHGHGLVINLVKMVTVRARALAPMEHRQQQGAATVRSVSPSLSRLPKAAREAATPQ
jgi:hypothetical protein